MSAKRSERSRWVQVFILPRPMESQTVANAQQKHDQLLAVAEAFQSVGRVVRIEPSKFGNGLRFMARKA